MNILITGASRGIGRMLALGFAQASHAVTVGYHTHREEALAVVRAIEEKGGRAQAVQANVRYPKEAAALVEAATTHWGRLDGLINNAGLTRDQPLLEMTEEAWRDVVDVNLSGAFWVLQSAARVMCRQKEGFILNVASYLAARGGRGCSNYAASKAGLVALSKSAAQELGPWNICVNALLPGFHVTDMNRQLAPKILASVEKEHTLGRTTSEEDLVSLALALARQRSASGQVYSFDSRIL